MDNLGNRPNGVVNRARCCPGFATDLFAYLILSRTLRQLYPRPKAALVVGYDFLAPWWRKEPWVRFEWTGAAALIGLLFFAMVMAKGWPSGAGWDAIGALATVFATAAALWLGYADTRRRNAEARRSAGIYKWIFGAEIAALKAALGEICEITTAIEEQPRSSKFRWQHRSVETLARNLELPMIEAHLDKLPNLPESFGRPIAALFGLVKSMKESVYELNLHEWYTEENRKVANGLRKRARIAFGHINKIDWPAS